LHGKSINSNIDVAANQGKSLVTTASEQIGGAAAKAGSAAPAAPRKVDKLAQDGEHRLEETGCRRRMARESSAESSAGSGR
jgi:hypothetical protein